ncbi:MAG: 3-phosphoshikimate 1-carboxyvinyltransferase [Pigmentiphaga sp.]
MTVSSSAVARRESLALPPVRRAQGSMTLPGSKSISNRVLLLAALAGGETTLYGVLDSDDTRVMLEALRTLGVGVAPGDVADSWRIAGGVPWPNRRAELFLGNAGTAFRPLTAALAMLGGDYTLSGVPRMHERPIGDLVRALRALGAHIQDLGTPGYPPLRLSGSPAWRLEEPVRVSGQVSSQFLTALLLAGPLATRAARRPLRIEVEGDLISKPYIEMTLNLMRRFGVAVRREGWQRFEVPVDAEYVSPGEFQIEGDASSASYFLALGAIGGGPVVIEGVGDDSIQGDVAFANTLEAMGARIEREPHRLVASGVRVAGGERLRAFDADFNLIPDAAMTAAVLALYADGPCRLRNIGSWRVKETDRILAMQTELQRLGATVEAGDDWLSVTPPGLAGGWRDAAAIGTYDDHRMAMCFSLAAFGPAAVTILDPDCVAKTFPRYFEVYAELVA